jgi:hypothetical protein
MDPGLAGDLQHGPFGRMAADAGEKHRDADKKAKDDAHARWLSGQPQGEQ